MYNPTAAPGDPAFLQEIFAHFAQKKGEELAAVLNIAEEIEEPLSLRALRRARILAQLLINEKGEVQKERVARLLALWEEGGEIFYPRGYSDSELSGHIHEVLKKLKEEPFVRMIKRFHAPVCHKTAEKFIRETLALPEKVVVRDTEVRRAALVACFTPLRQNIGSCFATAPAIFVQKEEIELMVSDLYELLTTGKLKRTIAGYDYSVPLSPDFKQEGACALLKAWEYTIASFCDVKREFSRWNLYSSLGLHPEEAGGIGGVVYKYMDEKLKECNEKVERYQADYHIAFDQVRATESLLRQAGSEAEARRLHAEHTARLYHMRACLDLRDKFYALSSHYADFFSFLYKQLEAKIDEYFQEIYDPAMQKTKLAKEYADSPAGFRLVYKQGRQDASLWMLIHTKEEYISCLVDFFRAIEPQVAYACEKEEEKRDVEEVITLLINHVRTQEFLESAIMRLAKAHELPFVKDPLADLDKLEKKPWEYLSGGTMPTLLKVYFRKEMEPKQEDKWVESEVELAVFILDTLKHLSPLYTDPYLRHPERGMFMQSPNHAFLLKPGWLPFREGWRADIFTYTWVRDNILIPQKSFYETLSLTTEEQRFLLDSFSDTLPPHLSYHLMRISTSLHALSIEEFRAALVEVAGENLADAVDAFLYQALPLTRGKDWKEAIRRIWVEEAARIDEVLAHLPDAPCTYFTAKTLKEAVKGCYLLAHKTIVTKKDLHKIVSERAASLKLSHPLPFLFADTNWEENYLGFVVNPGTGKLELWRMDRSAEEGVPLTSWKMWLDGTKKVPWTIFTRI